MSTGDLILVTFAVLAGLAMILASVERIATIRAGGDSYGEGFADGAAQADERAAIALTILAARLEPDWPAELHDRVIEHVLHDLDTIDPTDEDALVALLKPTTPTEDLGG